MFDYNRVGTLEERDMAKLSKDTKMEEAIVWISDHWGTLLTAIGAGGGGGLIGKKLIDKNQDKQIKELDAKVGDVKKRISNVETDLKLNNQADVQFRVEFKEHKTEMGNRMDKIDKGIEKITFHLLDKK